MLSLLKMLTLHFGSSEAQKKTWSLLPCSPLPLAAPPHAPRRVRGLDGFEFGEDGVILHPPTVRRRVAARLSGDMGLFLSP